MIGTKIETTIANDKDQDNDQDNDILSNQMLPGDASEGAPEPSARRGYE
jgi:hypothetical protein